MPLAEDSEEFRDTVRHFYATLEELHGKIGVVKVGAGGTGGTGGGTGPPKRGWGCPRGRAPDAVVPPRQVEKLIHPLLYRQYRLKKGSMERQRAGGPAVERVLFHGTTEASSREICLHGFNRSFCGKNGERR